MVDLPSFPWTVTMPHVVSGWKVVPRTPIRHRRTRVASSSALHPNEVSNKYVSASSLACRRPARNEITCEVVILGTVPTSVLGRRPRAPAANTVGIPGTGYQRG